MICEYEGGIIDHNVLIKYEISDKVVFLLGRAQTCNALKEQIDNPTPADYELLGKVACIMLGLNVWAADELPHVCPDCIGRLAEDICSRFRRKHKKHLIKKLRNKSSVRLGSIVHAAATFVAISIFEATSQWEEDRQAAAEAVDRVGVIDSAESGCCT